MIFHPDSLIPNNVRRSLLLDEQLDKRLRREDKARKRRRAERLRRETSAQVKEMAKQATAEAVIAAGKAATYAAHARIEELAAAADLKINAATAIDPNRIRIDNFDVLFSVRDQYSDVLRQRLENINAKVNGETRAGKVGYFNTAVHKNHIPQDRHLAILAHMTGVDDDLDLKLNQQVDAVIECGLFPRIRRGRFSYSRRCQDSDHCALCNYINYTDGVKLLKEAYSLRAFGKGGNWFAITIAPRANPRTAKARGAVLCKEDWLYNNPDSSVYGESRRGHTFEYPDPDLGVGDFESQSKARQFLGAAQFVLGKLIKNHWLDGVRARVENSLRFAPYTEHWHWHAVGSSTAEHDPLKMSEFIKFEVDKVLEKSMANLSCDVLVAIIPTAYDLTKWVNYYNKTTNLLLAVEDFYARHPDCSRTEKSHKLLLREVKAYLNRNRVLFRAARLSLDDIAGKHVYTLRRRYVGGTHRFGPRSILTEPNTHREWREKHAKQARKRREALKILP